MAQNDAVASTRAVVLRAERSSAWSEAIGGGFLFGIGVPPEAMRLSQDGLRCRIDTAPRPCFLPWSSVAGFHQRGGRILAVRLAPGVTAATPGVSGLDQHEIRRALRRREPRCPVGSLRRPPEDIDQALATFTAGRLRIR